MNHEPAPPKPPEQSASSGKRKRPTPQPAPPGERFDSLPDFIAEDAQRGHSDAILAYMAEHEGGL